MLELAAVNLEIVQLQLQKVEKLGPEAWSGVAAVDKGNANEDTSLGCRPSSSRLRHVCGRDECNAS